VTDALLEVTDLVQEFPVRDAARGSGQAHELEQLEGAVVRLGA
jgi:hypothetical protein